MTHPFRPSSTDLASTETYARCVYDELRRRAREAMRMLPPGQTMQPTAVVHQAYINLMTRGETAWRDEGHFLAVATLAIRAAVVDSVRYRQRLKRRGGRDREIHDNQVVDAPTGVGEHVLFKVDELLAELRSLDRRAADVVVFRFFMGMTEAQCASVLGVTDRTVRRDWTFAKSWLAGRLSSDTGAA